MTACHTCPPFGASYRTVSNRQRIPVLRSARAHRLRHEKGAITHRRPSYLPQLIVLNGRFVPTRRLHLNIILSLAVGNASTGTTFRGCRHDEGGGALYLRNRLAERGLTHLSITSTVHIQAFIHPPYAENTTPSTLDGAEKTPSPSLS